jgi:thiamine phosphate synthase YjbQ (UPF0047 family)
MTSVEVPYSIAAALPSLAVLDITNDVARAVAASGVGDGIAYISSPGEEPCVVRVNERESGFFCDLEDLLTRLVPTDLRERERLLLLLLGPRTEQVPFSDGRLCLGQWQRILMFGFGEAFSADWTLTLLG